MSSASDTAWRLHGSSYGTFPLRDNDKAATIQSGQVWISKKYGDKVLVWDRYYDTSVITWTYNENTGEIGHVPSDEWVLWSPDGRQERRDKVWDLLAVLIDGEYEVDPALLATPPPRVAADRESNMRGLVFRTSSSSEIGIFSDTHVAPIFNEMSIQRMVHTVPGLGKRSS